MPEMGRIIFRLIAGPPKKNQLLLLRRSSVRMQAGKRGDVSTGSSGVG
jgi:ribosomal protein S28E/S33